MGKYEPAVEAQVAEHVTLQSLSEDPQQQEAMKIAGDCMTQATNHVVDTDWLQQKSQNLQHNFLS